MLQEARAPEQFRRTDANRVLTTRNLTSGSDAAVTSGNGRFREPPGGWQSRAMATADTPAAATRSMAVRAVGAFAFQASTSCRESLTITKLVDFL
jgi:hypothetical protein